MSVAGRIEMVGHPAAPQSVGIDNIPCRWCGRDCFFNGDAVGNALATARGPESLDRLLLKRSDLSEPVRAMLRRRFGERVVF